MKTIHRAAAGAALLAFGAGAQALTFNFTFTSGTSAQAQQGFIEAGQIWSSLFSDNVALAMTVGTGALGGNVLAQAGAREVAYTYTQFRSALSADASSSSDLTALSSLQSGSSFGLLINRTSDNPNGSGSATPYLDTTGANNTTVRITTANAKALGLAVGSGGVGECTTTCDASIVFNSSFAYDYDRSNGITGGQFDFVGIAAHEIGHALGFISGVDTLDFNSPPNNGPFTANSFNDVSALDLFRYSAQSFAAGVIDWTADTRAKYFSIDGGATVGAGFSTGDVHGDGNQASHWKDDQGLGIMDPTFAGGELGQVSANDRLALDVIGWNLAPIPEPSTYALFGLGLLAIAARRRGLQRGG